MVINNATTSISFFPFVSFDDVGSNNLEIQVWHKNTKTMVSSQEVVSVTGTKVTLGLPSLSNIDAVAQNLDTVLIRIIYNDVLKWEYLATWSDENTNINKTFKQWDEVAPPPQQWIKI